MSGGSDNENAVELKVCDGTVCKAAVEVHPRQGCNHLFVYTLTGKPIAPRVFVAGVEDGCDGDECEYSNGCTHAESHTTRGAQPPARPRRACKQLAIVACKLVRASEPTGMSTT